MDLVRRFPPEAWASALEDWRWLPGLGGSRPLVASAFGDAFLQRDDGVWFLDTVEGSLTREWDDAEELQRQLNTAEGQDRFLLGGLVEAAAAAGREPGDDEVLSFTVLPVLGGPFEVDNVEVLSFVVAMSIAGQVHEQVKDLPPGTPISGVQIGD